MTEQTYWQGKAQEQRDKLESMIDETTLLQILEQIELVCREKADHLRVNWQSPNEAREWDRAADKLDKLSASLAI